MPIPNKSFSSTLLVSYLIEEDFGRIKNVKLIFTSLFIRFQYLLVSPITKSKQAKHII